MNKIIENRISQLAQTGFLKEDRELHALLKVLEKIESSDKFKGLGDQRMIDERIQKEQISFINNMQEMFSKGDLFLKFFEYHKGFLNSRNIWKVIGLVENRDSSSFSKVFAQERVSKDPVFKRTGKALRNKQRAKPRVNKSPIPKPKTNKSPEIIKKGVRHKEGS